MEKYITQNGIKYELRGEQYYPILTIAEQKEHKIGKYGLLHRDYIKQHRKGTYTTLLTEGTLNAHLHEIDVQANEMIEAIVANLAEERVIDEELKASDPLKWVAEMNNIKARLKRSFCGGDLSMKSIINELWHGNIIPKRIAGRTQRK